MYVSALAYGHLNIGRIPASHSARGCADYTIELTTPIAALRTTNNFLTAATETELVCIPCHHAHLEMLNAGDCEPSYDWHELIRLPHQLDGRDACDCCCAPLV